MLLEPSEGRSLGMGPSSRIADRRPGALDLGSPLGPISDALSRCGESMPMPGAPTA